MIKKFKKCPLPWVLGILIGAMVLLPLLLRLSFVHAFLQCYLAPLGSMRAQYLAVFATIVASFTAVMSAIMIQNNHESKEKREKEKKEKNNRANCITKLTLYLDSIQAYITLEDKNQPAIRINVDGWADYLSNISMLMLKEGNHDKLSFFEDIFCNVERHNGFVERKFFDNFAEQEIKNINVNHIVECINVLDKLSQGLH